MASKNENKSDTNIKKKKVGFFSKTKSYLFEYSALQAFTAGLAVVIFVAIYTVFSVISGDSVISNSSAESLAWVFGFLIVLAPITTVLYARTSAEEVQNPARINQTLRKVIYFMTLGVSLVSAVVFAIVAGYSATRVLFGLQATRDLVSISAPSAIIVLLHIYFLTLVLRQSTVSAKLRKLNILFKVLLALALSGLILGIAVVNKGDVSKDRKAVSDLLNASRSIDRQYKNTGSLPDNASAIQGLDQAIKDKFNNQTYVYKPILSNGYDEPVESVMDLEATTDSGSASSEPQPDIAIGKYSGGYQLCATFQTSKLNERIDGIDLMYPPTAHINYINYHDSGYQCFDLYAY